MKVRYLLLALLACFAALNAAAIEQIERYDVAIDVRVNGDILVTEKIAVTSEGNEIRRGIFRELPRYMDSRSTKMPVEYAVQAVRRDGQPEPFALETSGNALLIRIGSANVFLDNGLHEYEIMYLARNQVRYFDDHDELYWNVTGTYWNFPIEAARAEVTVPDGAVVTDTSAYTGRLGSTASEVRQSVSGSVLVFDVTRPLARKEGLTISVSLRKGVIEPPSGSDRARDAWLRYGSLGVLLASLLGVFGFSYRNFDRVGRDPPRLPVFPRYGPPERYSPGAVHTIYNRTVDGKTAFIATLMKLAIDKQMTIDTTQKKKTTLVRSGAEPQGTGLTAEDRDLYASLFRSGDTRTFGGKTDTGFVSDYTRFVTKLGSAYGSKYFRWNLLYTILAAIMSIGAIIVAIKLATTWTIWHTAAVLGLAAINGLFMYLMPAPTVLGEKVHSEIAGFKLYLETAEKLQMNSVEVGSDQPPPMSKDLYERFLPYAVALGVEKPWTRYFEKVLPDVADGYAPAWAAGNWHSGRVRDVTDSMISTMSSGVSSAMPQSSGSSGSGGGGFSGGGGGGGGGGGW